MGISVVAMVHVQEYGMSEKPVRTNPGFYVLNDVPDRVGHRLVEVALRACGVTDAVVTPRPLVRGRQDLTATYQEAHETQSIVVHALQDTKLREAAHVLARTLNVPSIDLLSPVIARLTDLLETSRDIKPELFWQLDEVYFRRIEAIEFAVAHDDGRRAQELDRAEIVLTGVSRTSKTPLSMYLGSHGWLVANVPLVLNMEPPASLFQIDPKRVFALTIRPERLAMLRQVRLTRLGLSAPDNYADPDFVRSEVRYAYTIFERGASWTIVDVTAKSIEESANEIIQILSERDAGTHMAPRGDANLSAIDQRL
jgi:regulator of PEP synthase PpsR (kinase-PPPase family)